MQSKEGTPMDKFKEIDDKELENATGGAMLPRTMKIECENCHEIFSVNVNRTWAKCPCCSHRHTFSG